MKKEITDKADIEFVVREAMPVRFYIVTSHCIIMKSSSSKLCYSKLDQKFTE